MPIRPFYQTAEFQKVESHAVDRLRKIVTRNAVSPAKKIPSNLVTHCGAETRYPITETFLQPRRVQSTP
jgi:hypothetical protein